MKNLLTTRVGSLVFKNPIIAASGTFGYGLEYDSYLNLNELGGVVTKGISLLPKLGNRPRRICETSSGMLNSIGLANIGLECFLKEKLPFLSKLDCSLIVNLYGETVSDFVEIVKALKNERQIKAVELNVSCPNVKKGGISFGTDPESVFLVTQAVKNETNLPVWVKLTPNVTDLVEIACSAVEAGADALCLINTLLGMAIDPYSRRPKLASIVGGLSGPAIKPIGLRMVWQVSKALPGIPLIGIGGIMTGEDVVEYLLAGASAVQVGSGNFYSPNICESIIEELKLFCYQNKIEKIDELIGALKEEVCL